MSEEIPSNNTDLVGEVSYRQHESSHNLRLYTNRELTLNGEPVQMKKVLPDAGFSLLSIFMKSDNRDAPLHTIEIRDKGFIMGGATTKQKVNVALRQLSPVKEVAQHIGYGSIFGSLYCIFTTAPGDLRQVHERYKNAELDHLPLKYKGFLLLEEYIKWLPDISNEQPSRPKNVANRKSSRIDTLDNVGDTNSHSPQYEARELGIVVPRVSSKDIDVSQSAINILASRIRQVFLTQGSLAVYGSEKYTDFEVIVVDQMRKITPGHEISLSGICQRVKECIPQETTISVEQILTLLLSVKQKSKKDDYIRKQFEFNVLISQEDREAKKNDPTYKVPSDRLLIKRKPRYTF